MFGGTRAAWQLVHAWLQVLLMFPGHCSEFWLGKASGKEGKTYAFQLLSAFPGGPVLIPHRPVTLKTDVMAV